MADSINWCDLKENAKHINEVATGRANGSPTGAVIDTSTNEVTGQVRDTLTGKFKKMDAQIDVALNNFSDSLTFNRVGSFADHVGDPLTTTTRMNSYSTVTGASLEWWALIDDAVLPTTVPSAPDGNWALISAVTVNMMRNYSTMLYNCIADAVSDMSISLNQIIETKNYYADKNSCGCRYVAEAGNFGDGLITHNVGLLTLVPIRNDYFDVRWAGAVPDYDQVTDTAITNSVVNLQAAIDYCMCVSDVLGYAPFRRTSESIPIAFRGGDYWIGDTPLNFGHGTPSEPKFLVEPQIYFDISTTINAAVMDKPAVQIIGAGLGFNFDGISVRNLKGTALRIDTLQNGIASNFRLIASRGTSTVPANGLEFAGYIFNVTWINVRFGQNVGSEIGGCCILNDPDPENSVASWAAVTVVTFQNLHMANFGRGVYLQNCNTISFTTTEVEQTGGQSFDDGDGNPKPRAFKLKNCSGVTIGPVYGEIIGKIDSIAVEFLSCSNIELFGFRGGNRRYIYAENCSNLKIKGSSYISGIILGSHYGLGTNKNITLEENIIAGGGSDQGRLLGGAFQNTDDWVQDAPCVRGLTLINNSYQESNTPLTDFTNMTNVVNSTAPYNLITDPTLLTAITSQISITDAALVSPNGYLSSKLALSSVVTSKYITVPIDPPKRDGVAVLVIPFYKKSAGFTAFDVSGVAISASNSTGTSHQFDINDDWAVVVQQIKILVNQDHIILRPYPVNTTKVGLELIVGGVELYFGTSAMIEQNANYAQ